MDLLGRPQDHPPNPQKIRLGTSWASLEPSWGPLSLKSQPPTPPAPAPYNDTTRQQGDAIFQTYEKRNKCETKAARNAIRIAKTKATQGKRNDNTNDKIHSLADRSVDFFSICVCVVFVFCFFAMHFELSHAFVFGTPLASILTHYLRFSSFFVVVHF